MGTDLIRELQLAGSQHLGAALLVMLPSGVAVCIAAIDHDRQRRLDEALALKGWPVGLVTIDCEDGALLARTLAFDPDAAVSLRELAQKLLAGMEQEWRLFRVRLLG